MVVIKVVKYFSMCRKSLLGVKSWKKPKPHEPREKLEKNPVDKEAVTVRNSIRSRPTSSKLSSSRNQQKEEKPTYSDSSTNNLSNKRLERKQNKKIQVSKQHLFMTFKVKELRLYSTRYSPL